MTNAQLWPNSGGICTMSPPFTFAVILGQVALREDRLGIDCDIS